MNETECLAELQERNRRAPDGDAERRLLHLRAAAFAERVRNTAPPAIPVEMPDGASYGLPVVAAADLDAKVLRKAISEFGALHVRGLVDLPRIAAMRGVIDCALQAQEACYVGAAPSETLPWYERSDLVIGGETSRGFVRMVGAVLAADSPRGMFHLLEMFYELELDRLITEFFGERPALSAEKTALRRSSPWPEPGGWHQDGRFLGTSIRSLNAWIALSDCGVDAPGLEFVPRRLHRIIETGIDGARYGYETSHELVEGNFPGRMIRPEFKQGDALLFDHFLMHRTWSTPNMTKLRYATESWFFAPSAYPDSQTGLCI